MKYAAMKRQLIQLSVFLVLLAVLLRLAPHRLSILCYNLASKNLEQNSYDKAIGYFKRSLEFYPGASLVHYGLADAYDRKQMISEALREYKETIKIDPGNINAYKRMAVLYLKQDMLDEAMDLTAFARSKFPGDNELKELLENAQFLSAAQYLNEGLEEYLGGKRLKAMRLLNMAIEIKPDFIYAYYSLAYLSFDQGDLEKSSSVLEKLLKLDPAYWPAYKLYGDIYFKQNEFDKAIGRYKKALSFNVKDAILYNDLGLSFMEMEEYGQAVKYLEKALQIEPANTNIRFNLANVYKDAGEFGLAASEYLTIQDYGGRYLNMHNYLADIYFSQGKDKLAQEEYKKEIVMVSRYFNTQADHPLVLNSLAHAYCGLNDCQKAEELVKRAIAIEPDFRDAYLTLAMIYGKTGRKEEAILGLKKAKQMTRHSKFIDKQIADLEKDTAVYVAMKPDKVILKNMRAIEGFIQEETDEKITMEVTIGNSKGIITLYRSTIEEIMRSGEKRSILKPLQEK